MSVVGVKLLSSGHSMIMIHTSNVLPVHVHPLEETLVIQYLLHEIDMYILYTLFQYGQNLIHYC